MKDIKISIIIPVYNVEKYLKRCLDSILNQNYTNWECIIINDGSKDNSGLMCKSYAAYDKRFIVIDKENGGVSSARNVGLQRASGDVIIFVDSDDWLENNAFETICLNWDDEYDVIIYSIYDAISYDDKIKRKFFEKIMRRNQSFIWIKASARTRKKFFKKSIDTPFYCSKVMDHAGSGARKSSTMA